TMTPVNVVTAALFPDPWDLLIKLANRRSGLGWPSIDLTTNSIEPYLLDGKNNYSAPPGDKLYQFVKYFVRRHWQLFVFVILNVAMLATIVERFHHFRENFIRPEFLCIEGIFYRGKRVTRAFASPYQIVAPGMAFDLFNLFYQLLEASQVANTTLTYRHVTVFAPTNRAFQKYNGTTKNLVLYHMCKYLAYSRHVRPKSLKKKKKRKKN
ncbi:Fasciclin-1, partial [Melipona quadrifasciata]